MKYLIYSMPLPVDTIKLEKELPYPYGRAFKERTFLQKIKFKKIDWIYIFSFWAISTIILIVFYLIGLMGDI